MLKTREDFTKAEEKVDKFLEVIGKGYKTSIGIIDINWKATTGPKTWLGSYKLSNVLRLDHRFWDATEFVIKEEDLRQRHKWDIMKNIKAHWYDDLSNKGKFLVKNVISGNLSIYQLSSAQLALLDIPFHYDKPTEEEIRNDLTETYNGEWKWRLKEKARKEMEKARETLKKNPPAVSYEPMSMDELERLCAKG